MDDLGCKHKLKNETDDEHSHVSNKRHRNSPTDENLNPSSSVERSSSSSSSSSRRSFFINQSATKSSPFSSILTSEMGFGVLDSDESNESSIASNAIGLFAAPSSALSMIPNTDNSDESNVDESDLAEPFSESESNLEHSNPNTMSDLNLSSSEASSQPITLAGSESKSSNFAIATVTETKSTEPFQVYQDFKHIIMSSQYPCTRTSQGGVMMATNATFQSTSITPDQVFVNPPEGRAIRGATIKKFTQQNETPETGTPMKHKGRSPLATIGNATPLIPTLNIDDVKKSTAENCFFMYQKRDPRLYTGDDNFAKLSDEILLSIFKWLPKKALHRCSLVNRQFHKVIQDESLWARLDLAGRNIQKYALGRILQRGTIILRLAQSKILEPIFDPSQIQKDFFSKVQYLDLSMVVISTTALAQLFSKCRQLRKLSLEHVPLNDAVCKVIAQNRKLEVLNLAMCTGLTTYGIKKLLTSLKVLHTLNISWTSLEVDALRELSNYINEHMTRLNIAGCRKTMSDDILKKIISRCPNLRELDLSDCTALTSNTIDIVASLKHLEYLSLSRCYNINASAYYYEINKLESLAYLDIFGLLSPESLGILNQTFPDIGINQFKHSAVARPTVGSRRTSIWGLRTRD